MRRSAWRLLAGAILVQCGVSIVDQGLPALVGFIKLDAGLSATVAGLVVSAFVFGRCLGSYAAGIAADRVGERRVLVVGAALTGVLVVVAAAVPIGGFFAVLVVAGLASAVSTPAGGRLVLVAFPRERHGLALGLRQTAVPLGGLIAAALLPWLAHATSWRWSLATAGCLAAASVVPLALSRTFDPRDEPVVSRTRFKPARNRNILLLTAWGSMFVSAQYALLAFLALDLNQRTGISLAGASVFVAAAQIGGICGRIGWGAVSDRMLSHGRKPLLLALTGVGFAATLGLYLLPRSSPTWWTAAVAVFAGLGVIGFQGLFVTMIADVAGRSHVGAATGFSVTFVQVAVVVASPAYGFLADRSGSYHTIWLALTVVLALSCVPAAFVREPEAQAVPLASA